MVSTCQIKVSNCAQRREGKGTINIKKKIITGIANKAGRESALTWQSRDNLLREGEGEGAAAPTATCARNETSYTIFLFQHFHSLLSISVCSI